MDVVTVFVEMITGKFTPFLSKPAVGKKFVCESNGTQFSLRLSWFAGHVN